MKNLLHHYADCSCQLVKFEKSNVFFSTNVVVRNRIKMACILRVTILDNMECYLGLHVMVSGNKKNVLLQLCMIDFVVAFRLGVPDPF